MATLEYANIPLGATRLRSSPGKVSGRASTDIRHAPTIFTSLPNPSPPHTPRHPNQATLPTVTSPTLGYIPQLLLSGVIPGLPIGDDNASMGNSNLGATNPRQELEPEKYTLLSTKDPLSLPIMTNNFKRFVSKVGPIFWLQDRGEEILLWKRGWKVTGTWMALYTFLCYYPRFILLLPHVALIAVMLATYPYPKTGEPFAAASHSMPEPTQQPAAEGMALWQANIQAIQNLMGAVSDAFAACEPYVHHFVLSPAHFKDSPSATTAPSQFSPSPNQPISPYTPHILTLLLCTFPIMVLVVSLPAFPIREVCLVGGLAPFLVTHPRMLRLLPSVIPVLRKAMPIISAKVKLGKRRLLELGSALRLIKLEKASKVEEKAHEGPSKPIPMILQRLIDDDRLTDKAWNSELAEVELWENERLDAVLQDSSSNPQTSPWSKSHLKPGERTAWTRGRDGSNGVGTQGVVSGIEAGGEVSSNLTFSLAPGWSFVETEDWRKDLTGEWSGVGADEDGWVYSNDSWLGPRPAPYTAGGGSVTRRRRWMRRVWYDPDLAKEA